MRPSIVAVRFLAASLVLTALAPAPARATWSVVAADHETGEIGVASVTCLNNFDLRAITPVIVVGVGAAAVQASGDFDGIRRPVIRDELDAGSSAQEILDAVSGIGGHQSRQYGIVDTRGGAVSFSGSGNLDWAGGVTGELGTMVHAIQGNILTGSCVVAEAEAAFLSTPGDMAEKLMAAMEAARDAGGDGRCSCTTGGATSCGCPPPVVTKSGEIGYLIVARLGDRDDPTCNQAGCADGDYCLNLNYAFQGDAQPDPVTQMRAGFDAWANSQVGVPDAVRSEATIVPVGDDFEMELRLLDRDGNAATRISSVRVAHEPDSAGVTSIGAAEDRGGGLFVVPLTVGPGAGLDRFLVTVDAGVRVVPLTPSPELCVRDPCACWPGDPSNTPPREASDLRVTGATGTLVSWIGAADAASSNLHSGTIAMLRADRGTASATCFALNLWVPSAVDRRPTPTGGGFFYLAEGRNACGDGGVGPDSTSVDRSVTPCP